MDRLQKQLSRRLTADMKFALNDRCTVLLLYSEREEKRICLKDKMLRRVTQIFTLVSEKTEEEETNCVNTVLSNC